MRRRPGLERTPLSLLGGGLLALGSAHPGAAQADLTVLEVDTSAVTGDWQTLEVTGPARALVTNLGSAPTGTTIEVLFFADTNLSRRFEFGTDTILGRTTIASLAPAATSEAIAPLAGQVAFRDDLVFAYADSGGIVAETDETNNLYDSGRDCSYLPSVGSFDPVVEWAWTATAVMPDWLNVMTTPAVIDLDNDRIPEVVFPSTASIGGGRVEVGVLRALRGDDGSELFTVDDPALRVNATSSVAVADIDGDRLPGIVACDDSGLRLIAFESDGTFKWRSTILEPINWGAPAIADLDGDGSPEIVLGRQVLDAAGGLVWTGTGGRGAQTVSGALSLVADVDRDGAPEVVAGNTLYGPAGSLEWQAPVADGFPAVADFDADPFAEIILVAGGQVHLLEHDGTVAWGPSLVPGGGGGGPPIIADYDADGEVEVGVAGAVRYAVFETDGSLKWEAVTQDASSSVSGSSAFDFDGDGSAEVVYRDELFLRIYRGTDGAVLFETPMSSCTWFEYVLVADVDADRNAEIVAVANNNCGLGSQRGVTVIGDADDNWVRTRALWNQHTYHITNIDDRGRIPAVEADNWQTPPGAPYNNFRQNLQTSDLPPVAAPDLTVSLIRCGAGGVGGRALARIGNGGATWAAAGLGVSFYDGDPSSGGTLLGTVPTSRDLGPGEYEDVPLDLPPGFDLAGTIYVAADDDGSGRSGENECDETNNLHWRAGLLPVAAAGADVTVCELERVLLDGDPSAEPICALEYEWREGAVVRSPWRPLPRWWPPPATVGVYTYTLAVRCAALPGCEATDEVVVDVEVCHLDASIESGAARWLTGADEAAVEVTWATAAEDGTAGFAVERAVQVDGPYAAVGEAVRALGAGTAYRLVDGGVVEGSAVWYRVVELTIAGDRGLPTRPFTPSGRGRRR